MRRGVALMALAWLAGCHSASHRMELTLVPRPGRACDHVAAGEYAAEMDVKPQGCGLSVQFGLDSGTTQELRMKPPSDTSSVIQLRVGRSRAVVHRTVTLEDISPVPLPWKVPVEDSVVGPGGLSPSDAATFDLRAHRFVVLVLSSRTPSGATYPLPVSPNQRAADRYKLDRGYCVADVGVGVRLYRVPEDGSPVVYDPRLAMGGYRSFCSPTHQNVIALDLGDAAESVVDIELALPNHDPRIVRLPLGPASNYTVVEVALAQAL